ncbi:MAG: GNAT family N-acetyltransferase [Bacteroidales bacterium]|nr:GNAT family N-acetyltransferase [Bacteroidales bacterium]
MGYEFARHSTDIQKIKEYSSFLSSPFVSSSRYFREERTTPDYLRWQYVSNPAGNVLGYSAYSKGKIVGHFSTLPVRYLVKGVKCEGLLALNLVTHPDHRGKGIFLAMCERTFRDAYEMGYQFIAGVANQNSTHGLVNRLGFELISGLEVRAGYGNIQIDKRAEYGLRPLWEPDTLKWRLSNPSATYFVNDSKFIITGTGRFGINAQIYQMEEGDADIIRKNNSNNRLRLWIGLGKMKKIAHLHMRLPEAVKPVPLNLIFKKLRGDRLSFSKHEILFELIDFDAY